MSLSVHLCDGVAAEARLQQVTFLVEGVTRRAVKTGGEFAAVSFLREFPDEFSKIRRLDIPDQVGSHTADLVAQAVCFWCRSERDGRHTAMWLRTLLRAAARDKKRAAAEVKNETRISNLSPDSAQ